ncbi:MAG: methyltransferase domain-containing protein [Candidatus Diapherotrites archaeon]|uniref:Methyltransferase domain-containing protein n=1 Tax=Candidatus Iainarchaeum sp. TaxID=3101447 RepID=A0A939C8L3_9ARCH|nr:methyltransferase domain-containing protein [Candidatus Diapherotrites archaeon]
MPVFGKGRKNRERPKFLNKTVIAKSKSGRLFSSQVYEGFTSNSFKTVKIMFPLVFWPLGLKSKTDFLKDRFAEKGKPLVVLDWGCGKGSAVSGLARNYGRKVKAYGFSRTSYGNWSKIKNAKLIHSTKESLLRYLKDGSVDLIYSHLGLVNIWVDPKDGVNYTKKLCKKLAKGGKLAFFLPEVKGTVQTLQKALGREFDVVEQCRAIYITRK